MNPVLRATIRLTTAATVLLATACGTTAPRRVATAPAGFYEGRLANGMSVIIQEDHASKVAAIQIYVKAGSRNETPEISGVSHFIEHLIFKGTPRRPLGQVAKDIEERGGELNAYTSRDETVYWAIVPSPEVAIGIDVLLDGVFNARFDATDIEKEREVVLEELRRALDSPERRMYDLLGRTSHPTHPYGRPVLGTEETLRRIGRNEIVRYHERWYRPGNMIAVVVGDVNSSDVKALLEKSGGGARKQKTPRLAPPTDPAERSGKIAAETSPSRIAYLALSFPVPNARHEDVPALDALGSLLAGGKSSLLTSRLEFGSALVKDIVAYADTPEDPGLFVIWAEMNPEHVTDALKQILETLHQVKKGFPREGLERAKFLIEKDQIEQAETMQGKAHALGYGAAYYGDPLHDGKYLAAVQALKKDDVVEAARRYLLPERMNVTLVYPEHLQKSAADLEQMLGDTVRRAASETGALSMHTLKNGLHLILWETTTAPTVAVAALATGGVRAETPDRNGVGPLLSRVWTRGTEKMTGEAIDRRLDEIGSSIEAFSGMNSLGLQAHALRSSWEETFDLYWTILTQPALPEAEIQKSRKRLLTQIEERERNLSGRAFQRLRENLFAGHPYGLESLGNPESVRRLTREDLAAHYSRWVSPERTVLSIVGDFDARRFLDEHRARLESWQRAGARGTPHLPSAPIDPPERPQARTYPLPSEQVHLLMGYIGPPYASADRPALDVVDAALSNQSGRLFVNLRDKEALAYVVAFQTFYGVDTGYLAAYLACDPDKANRAREGLSAELAALLKGGLTAEEIAAAKRYLTGSYQIRLERNSDKAMTTALDEALGLGFDHFEKYEREIQEVTSEDVRAALSRYIQPDRTTLITLGGAK
ncbi:MAG: insulinase family protein [Nitrospirae bacterium]|nr:insulinase family protein [Nitrospirota bacterium]